MPKMRSWVFLVWVAASAVVGAQPAVDKGPDFPQGYYSGDPLPESTVYLTFDDGPAPDTATILDILKAEGVHATFFINSFNRYAPPERVRTENNLLRYVDVLRRMVNEGHVIGDHTFSHRDLGQLSADEIAWQLKKVQLDLDEALGPLSPPLRLMRPPFGSPWLGNWGTAAQRERAARVVAGHYLVMNWTRSWDSADSADWVPGEAQRLVNPDAKTTRVYTAKEQREVDRLLRHADGHTGGVILFHDTHPTSRDVLKQVIDDYKSLGYSFDTLDHYAQWRWGPDVLGTLK